ncbi:hypothetical protein K4Q22_00400 [Staphylococcus epidermidis]|nr:hypothetical protein [Staphylococcus epidermidis]
MAQTLMLLIENGDKLIMGVVVQIATIISLIFTGYQVYMVRKENKENKLKESTKNNRKSDILNNNLNNNIKYLEESYLKFNHNYNIYVNSINNDNIESKLDTISYYILSYVNSSFINRLEKTKQSLDNYYQDSISNAHIDYNTYTDIKNSLEEIIKNLSNAKLVLDSYIPSYDEKLIFETKEAVINKVDTKNLCLIDDNFNGSGNTFVVNPLMYYKKILYEYRYFFYNENDIPILLIEADSELGKESRFTKVFNFKEIHTNLSTLIEKLKNTLSDS